MKVKVIENVCIGCGACQAIAPDNFEINDNGVATALDDNLTDTNKEIVEEAKDNCPTGAINISEE